MIQMVPSSCVNQASPVPESTTLVTIQCQADSFGRAASSRVPVLIDHLQRAMELRRRSGFIPTLRKILAFVQKQLRRLVSSSNKPQTANSALDVPLALSAGELVEVKSAAEIAATLDASNSLKGLTFLPAMTQSAEADTPCRSEWSGCSWRKAARSEN